MTFSRAILVAGSTGGEATFGRGSQGRARQGPGPSAGVGEVFRPSSHGEKKKIGKRPEGWQRARPGQGRDPGDTDERPRRHLLGLAGRVQRLRFSYLPTSGSSISASRRRIRSSLVLPSAWA